MPNKKIISFDFDPKYLKVCNFNKTAAQSGITLLEIVIVIALITIILTTLTVIIRPTETKARARDNKRLSDISNLDRVILEYKLDNGEFPDSSDVLRTSNVLPETGISLDNASGGWILADFLTYTSSLPLDPVNDDTYFYSYIHNGNSYEVSTFLEYLTDEPQNDGGNDPNSYELGNGLTLISP